jgi:peptidoglycan DL-endopeptidase CwlO
MLLRTPSEGVSVTIRYKAGAVAGPMTLLLAVLPGMTNSAVNAKTESFNQKAAGYVETFIGRVPYRYGGSSPSSGFDCSGLTQYVYHHYGKSIPRTADAQFRYFHRESRSRAWGGDLVFLHDNSSPNSHVYHVGIYEGSSHMVSAADRRSGIVWQGIWSSDVTFGTITH